ncbi:UNVERIFIED_CONTAM: hypothetical protein K2H54_046979 [Gekko kuhli]
MQFKLCLMSKFQTQAFLILPSSEKRYVRILKSHPTNSKLLPNKYPKKRHRLITFGGQSMTKRPLGKEPTQVNRGVLAPWFLSALRFQQNGFIREHGLTVCKKENSIKSEGGEKRDRTRYGAF